MCLRRVQLLLLRANLIVGEIGLVVVTMNMEIQSLGLTMW